MHFRPTPLSGLTIIEPRAFEDARGFFAETYREDLFAKNGIPDHFVQDNHSSSARGTLRGLHYQKAPFAQAKLMKVVVGEIFDVAVDLRPGSATYGKWFGVTLSAANRLMLYVPTGFAHGFLVMSDRADVLYQTSAYYSPAHEVGIAWNDPTIGVQWPDAGCPYILSDRDRKNPPLEPVRAL